jgi:uncharacterized protein with FMN-binding domain
MRFLFVTICVLLILPGLTGCPTDGEPGQTGPSPIEGKPSGTATAAGDGFARSQYYLMEGALDYGREITVTVTLDEGYITDVVISGPDESGAYGQVIIQKAPAVIKAKNTFDVNIRDVDAVSIATSTLKGIKDAGNGAIDKIKAGK